MEILCIICSEFMTSEEDIIVTPCGHCFHGTCIKNWIKNSYTCPTCRKTLSQSSLIKVFFETDPSRFHALHNDLLKSNESLTKELDDIKDKSRKQEAELLEINAKFRDSSDRIKKLERDRQLDEMALAGLRMIKDESVKEHMKLNAQLNTMKLDLLAEKQLRRVHQTTLHKLDPGNENYDIKSIAVDEHPVEQTASNYDITPFWQLNPEAAKPENVKSDRPYLIPSKIQKANDIKLSTKKAENPVPKKRSSSREEADNGPSTSSNTIRFSFAENSNDQTSAPPSSSIVENAAARPKSPFKFSFGSSSGFSSLFRFGGEFTAPEPSTSQQPASSSISSRLNLYRDNNKDLSNPRSSDR
ncbi:hypothetical protein ACKWTF_003817 [Chironomus riparius]